MNANWAWFYWKVGVTYIFRACYARNFFNTPPTFSIFLRLCWWLPLQYYRWSDNLLFIQISWAERRDLAASKFIPPYCDWGVPIHGQCELLVKIGSTEVMQQMWVADIHNQCILGLDFLAPWGCLGQSQGQQSVDWWRVGATAETKLWTVIPTMLSYCFGWNRWSTPTLRNPCTSQGPGTSTCKWEVESDSSNSINGVMTGRTLVDLEKPTVPVRILNLTNKEKRNKNSA